MFCHSSLFFWFSFSSCGLVFGIMQVQRFMMSLKVLFLFLVLAEIFRDLTLFVFYNNNFFFLEFGEYNNMYMFNCFR